MEVANKATRIDLFNFSTRPMRAFHMSWFSFFLCFFAWFGIAPLMDVVRDELHLTKEQVGNTIIASVAITILARLFIGWRCDRIGPRLCYTGLLVVGSIPVLLGAIFLVHSPQGLFAHNEGLQFTLFVLCSLRLLFWRGSGRFSLDHLLRLSRPEDKGGAAPTV